jgi:hypothetical protein
MNADQNENKDKHNNPLKGFDYSLFQIRADPRKSAAK